MELASLFKQAIASLVSDGPKAAYYFVIGNYRWWLHKDAIADFLEKSKKCPDCMQAGSCLHHLIDGQPCGCPFGPVALSKRPCNEQIDNQGA